MKRNILYRFLFVFILFVVLYMIWPVPFWYVAKNVILPTSQKVKTLARIIYSPVDILVKINGLAKENKKLSEENLQLKSQIVASSQDKKLCLEIAQENLSSGRLGGSSISARVIGRTPQDFNRILVLNKGSDDGVKKGAAVLSMGYLVGRINNILSSQSEVTLVTDHKSLIPAILEKSRQTGLVQGGLEGLILSEVPINSVIEKGENVLTSGLGGDFPTGVIIGQIKETQKSGSLFQSAKIEYPISSSKIEVVSIIK